MLVLTWMYIMHSGSTIDGIKELTSMTLDSDMPLRERIQQPAGVSLDQYVHLGEWTLDGYMSP